MNDVDIFSRAAPPPGVQGRRETNDRIKINPAAQAQYEAASRVHTPTHRVQPEECAPAIAACRSCGLPTPTARFDPSRADPRARLVYDDVASLADAFRPPPDMRDASGPDCPRCRMIAAAPWAALGYSSLTASAVAGDARLRLAMGSSRNKLMDDATPPEGSLFDAGSLGVTGAAFAAIRAGLPTYTDPVVLFRRRQLARHQMGDFGDLGRADAVDPADVARGVLGPLPARNVAAIRSGRGEVVSRYPLLSGPPLVVWTALGGRHAGPLTLACMGDEKCSPFPQPIAPKRAG